MALVPGTRLGPYEIAGLIGAGGMGEVYRARDGRLRRDVALKIIPERFQDDPDRVARFHREAHLLAALNHPHIASIHGLEEASGVHFLVLELVDGESLERRLVRGAMPIAQALRVATQIADALEAAHGQGIIHLDLKPANIVLTRDDQVKVLDFGLAKATDGSTPDEVWHLPTETVTPTQGGVIRGTAAYMSPEQARGLATNPQTDIWAFGCVLYELLTGRRAFPGKTTTDTLAAVLTSLPDWRLLPPATPDGVVRLLHHCLQKDSRQRLKHIGDARIELEASGAAPVDRVPAKARMPHPTIAAVVAVVALASGALAATWLRPWSTVPAPSPIERLSIVMPPDHTLREGPSIAISRDGRRVAFVARRDGIPSLFVRDVADANARVLVETGLPYEPFFSPDGESIGFFADRKLKTISVSGGTPLVLCDAADPRGGSWGADGLIVFAPTSASHLFQMSARGGIPKPLTTLDAGTGEASHRWPQILPGNRAVLFAAGSAGSQTNSTDGNIQVQSLQTGQRHVVVARGTYPRVVQPGHLLYVEYDAIFAQRFDVNTLTASGSRVTVLEDVDHGAAGQKPFDVSASGTVVYAPGSAARPHPLFMLESSGTLTQLPFAPARFRQPKVSPDGRRVAVGIADADTDLWVYDIASGARTRLTSAGSNRAASWTRDGRRIVYAASRGAKSSIYSRAADASAPEEELARLREFPLAVSLLPDNRTLIFDSRTDDQAFKIDLADAQHPRPWLAAPSGEFNVTVSPDGELAAYVSNQAGRAEVYVRPSSGKGAPVQVSTASGFDPVWAHSGRELFFLDFQRNVLMAVSVTTTPTLTVSGPRRILPEGSAAASLPIDSYDVMPDDRHFLVVKNDAADPAGPHELSIVTNWFRELNARVR